MNRGRYVPSSTTQQEREGTDAICSATSRVGLAFIVILHLTASSLTLHKLNLLLCFLQDVDHGGGIAGQLVVDEYAQLRGKSGEEETLPLRVRRSREDFSGDGRRRGWLAPEEEEFGRVAEEWVGVLVGVTHYWTWVTGLEP